MPSYVRLPDGCGGGCGPSCTQRRSWIPPGERSPNPILNRQPQPRRQTLPKLWPGNIHQIQPPSRCCKPALIDPSSPLAFGTGHSNPESSHRPCVRQGTGTQRPPPGPEPETISTGRRSSRIDLGEDVPRFEPRLRQFQGSKHAGRTDPEYLVIWPLSRRPGPPSRAHPAHTHRNPKPPR